MITLMMSKTGEFFSKAMVFSIVLLLTAGITVACGGEKAVETMKEEEEEAAVPIVLANYFAQPPAEFSLYKSNPVIKGIYVSGPRAGSEAHMPDLIDLCSDSEANAMVLDVKTEEGIVTFKDGIAIADEMEISKNLIPDIRGVLASLDEKNIYSIGRVVAFKDNLNFATRPELYIKDQNGNIWLDPQKMAWLNPYNKDSWDFVMEFAKGAAQLGFDEIQFDYIRFAASQRLENADFGDTMGKTRGEIIAEFAQYAKEQLQPYGVVVSADVYGTIINSDVDAEIVGQNYAELARILDVVCPMVYPSHYAENTMGIDFPDKHPYDTIYESMKLSEKRLSVIPEGEHRAIIRPWLQDFTASWLSDYLEYGPEERWGQIRAVYDSGLSEWLLWDAGVSYEREGMTQYPPEETGG